jgi:hypothetical protein
MPIASLEKPKTSNKPRPSKNEASKNTTEQMIKNRKWVSNQMYSKAREIAREKGVSFQPTRAFYANTIKGLEMVEKMLNIKDNEAYPDTVQNLFNFVDRNGDMFLSDTISLEQFVEAQAAMIVTSIGSQEKKADDTKEESAPNTVETTSSPAIETTEQNQTVEQNSNVSQSNTKVGQEPQIETTSQEKNQLDEESKTTNVSQTSETEPKSKKVIRTSRQKEDQNNDIDFFHNLISQNLTSSQSSPPAISSNIIETVGSETVDEQDENDDDQLDMQLQLKSMKSALKNNFENINESLSDLDDKKITFTNEIKEEIYQTIGEAISTIAMVGSMDGAYRESDLEYFNSMLVYLQNKKDMMNNEEFLDIVKELCDTYKSLTK